MYIVDFLQSRGIGFETLLHRPAFSATRRARNMRVTGREVAKTVLVKSGEEFVLALRSESSGGGDMAIAAAMPLVTVAAAIGELELVYPHPVELDPAHR